MFNRKFNLEKELKKAQKKGLYNPKIKVVSLLVSVILVIFITSSFAWFTSSSSISEAFSGNVVKKASVKLKVTNGTITGDATKKVEVPNSTTFTVTPNSNYYYSNNTPITCTNNQTATYDSTNNTLTISPTKDTECTILFVNDVTVTIEAYNASVSGTLSKTVEAYQETIFGDLTITPDSNYELMDIICTNSQSAEYDDTNNELAITPTMNTTCTLVFGDNSMLLSTKIMARGVEENIPSTVAFQYGEPTAKVGVSGATYREYTKNYTTVLTSDNDKTIGSGYTFDSTSGKYTLTGTTVNVSYDTSYVGYYTCNNATYENCVTMYKIDAVNGSSVTASTKYTQAGSISGSGLFCATDNDGTSYYLRGEINDNYVRFAGKTWRVVRINGDGSIRLILQSNTGTLASFNHFTNYSRKYVGYTYDNASLCTTSDPCISNYNVLSNTFNNNKNMTNSTIKDYLENWYITNLTVYDSKVAIANYCNDTTYTVNNSVYSYGGRNRVSVVSPAPSLSCPNTGVTYGGLYKLKIGLISADELNMIGHSGYINSQDIGASSLNYLYSDQFFLGFSPFTASSTAATIMGTRYGIAPKNTTIQGNVTIRPVINILPNSIVTSGDGTSESPYQIYFPN